MRRSSMKRSTAYVIPKDPRTRHTVFLTGMPRAFEGILDQVQWYTIVDTLNKIILRYEQPTFLNFLKILLVIPALLESRNCDVDVREYLNHVNQRLTEKGIFINDPSTSSYMELYIIYRG